MGAFIIIISIITVIFIILLFVIGLFTHLSPSFILLIMYVFLLFIFILTAGYAGDAAGKTGGKDADAANKSAHGYYTWAAVISWIVIGIAVLVIIGGIILAFLGAPEEAAAGAAAEGTVLAEGGIAAEVGGLASQTSSEGAALAKKIAREKKQSGGFLQSGKKGGFSKILRTIMYILLGTTILLAFVIGLLLAIGAIVQGGSSSKAGLKKAAIGATLSIFVTSMYIIFFIVMYFRGKSIHKKLEADLAAQEEMTQEYLEQRQVDLDQAKGQYARQLISHHFGLNQPSG